MREILFRAKRKDNEEWVYGSLIHVQDEINKDVDIYRIQPYKYEDTTLGKPFEVKKETVGQYINMKDIKGNKIFVGDILEDCVGEKGIVEDEFGIRMELAFNDFDYFTQEDLISYEVKIIGNIYDNEELIKKVRNDEQ